jgi:lipoprotein-releasing system ATP-binding protein
MLKVKNVNKHFYDPVDVHILKNVSFEMDEGEFVSIMGKSGCGKSTLLYILSTMDTSYKGEVWLNDQCYSQLSEKELAILRNEHIGFVFQFHYLLPEFTVLDNVMMPALKLGYKTRKEIEADAYAKLGLLGIDDQAKKKATQISGGQKQRVAIARALINNPKVIMGDEPTGNLDSKNAQLVFNIFKNLTDEINTSLLIVTHDEDFASKTDRVIHMADGEIISK